MAYCVAQAIIRPPRVFACSSSSRKGELECKAFPSSGKARGILSWPLRDGHSPLELPSLALSSAKVAPVGNFGFSPRKLRRKQRSCFASWICFYYVAQSEIQKTDSRNEAVEGVKKGRKSRIQKIDNAEIGTSRTQNGFSHVELVENQSETTEQSAATKRTRKKAQESTSKASGQSVGSSTTPSRKGRKKKTDSLETTQERDGFSDETDSDIKVSYDSEEYGSSAETEDESEVAVEQGSRSGNTLVANGETGTAEENGDDLRLLFLESLMERARSGDVDGVEEALSEMEIAGLQPGPRAYHGLIVSYVRARDFEGALQAFRRELSSLERPLPETFVALARLFGSLGQALYGEEILAAMEKLHLDCRAAWLILVEELQKGGHLQEANRIFLKGSNGGMRGVPHVYSSLIEENAKVGDHGSAIDILRTLEYAGYQPTTFHYNCLLMCQANANVPEVATSTFETMQYGSDEMKPDTDSYNWLLQVYVRNKHGDRCQEIVDIVGEMVEDHKRVQPNMKTYSLLVECFTKYNVVSEAVRYFRALSRIPGGTNYLHDEGKNGDPLSLYLRALCLEGRALELLEALEAMVKDQQEIPPRAMLVNQKGRTLVSSWIEPIGAEADLGFEVDYVSRYVAQGGAAGTRKRWSDLKARLEDNEGFAFWAPAEMSFKQHATQMHRRYIFKLIAKLRAEGVQALGPGATEADLVRVMVKLRKETVGDSIFQPRKPKAASKMLVSELKEELEAQGLPSDGTRPVLYQRVQKARRVNRSRGRPLWIPASEDESEEEEEDESTDIFIKRLNLINDNTEFWRKRLIGEDQETELFQATLKQLDGGHTEEVDIDDGDEDEDDNDNDNEEVEEETEEIEDLAEDGTEDEGETPGFLALQLLKKAELSTEEKVVDDEDVRGQWLGLTLEQKIAKIRTEKLLDSSEIYTIADVWGWTWEKQIRAKEPECWSQELEVQIGMQMMQRVLDLGSAPTVGDCAILVRAAMRIPWPEAIVSLIQQTHKLGIKFGSNLYNEAMKLCITQGENGAAMAIITYMEEMGIPAPTDVINTVLMESSEVEESQETS